MLNPHPSHDDDASGIDPLVHRYFRHLLEPCVTVFYRTRMRILKCEKVFHRHHNHLQFHDLFCISFPFAVKEAGPRTRQFSRLPTRRNRIGMRVACKLAILSCLIG